MGVELPACPSSTFFPRARRRLLVTELNYKAPAQQATGNRPVEEEKQAVAKACHCRASS